jgi:hypothetical protein
MFDLLIRFNILDTPRMFVDKNSSFLAIELPTCVSAAVLIK